MARLDATLAELTADRRPDEGATRERTADVVPLGSRRRRWIGAALVAAAAVVAVGVGIGPLVDGWRGSDGDAGDAGMATSADDSGEAEGPSSPLAGAESVPRVRPAHFDRDVALVRDGPFYLTSERGTRSSDALNELGSGSAVPCGPDPNAAERAVPVRYQRQPATLLFRAPQDGTQVVELYVCSEEAAEPADGDGTMPRNQSRTGTEADAERVTTLVVP